MQERAILLVLLGMSILITVLGLVYAGQFKFTAAEDEKTHSDVIIRTVRRRYLKTGHCDIDTYAESLIPPQPHLARNAIISVGAVRTLLDTWASQWRTIVKPNDIDLYVYTRMSPKPTAADCFGLFPLLATGRVRALVVHRLDEDQMVEHALHIDKVTLRFPYENTTGIILADRPRMLAQYWLLYKAHEVFTKVRGDHRYRFVIKLRPDIYFGNRANTIDLDHDVVRGLTGQFGTPDVPFISITNCDHWGGLNDQYAVMDSNSADLYFTSVKYWDQYDQDKVYFQVEFRMKYHMQVVHNIPYFPIESALGIPTEENFEFCLRRPAFCKFCSKTERVADYPAEYNF